MPISILTPDQTAQLASNGLSPDVDYLQTTLAGKVICGFLLTYIEPGHGREAYGLLDFGNGKARMGILFLNQLKS